MESPTCAFESSCAEFTDAHGVFPCPRSICTLDKRTSAFNAKATNSMYISLSDLNGTLKKWEPVLERYVSKESRWCLKTGKNLERIQFKKKMENEQKKES